VLRRLRTKGYDAFVLKIRRRGETFYRVRVGHYVSLEEAQQVARASVVSRVCRSGCRVRLMSSMTACTPSVADFLELSRGGNLVPVFARFWPTPKLRYQPFSRRRAASTPFCSRASWVATSGGATASSDPSRLPSSPVEGRPCRSRSAGVRRAVSPRPIRSKRCGNSWPDITPVSVAGLPRFFGGAVGYVAYDAVRFFERLPATLPDPLGLPELYFIVPASSSSSIPSPSRSRSW